MDLAEGKQKKPRKRWLYEGTMGRLGGCLVVFNDDYIKCYCQSLVEPWEWQRWEFILQKADVT